MKAVVFDFDGTMAATFEDSPVEGMNVPKAYELAIESCMGTRALSMYREAGGLRNRAPSEVVAELVERLGIDLDISVTTEALIQDKIRSLTACVGEMFHDGSMWPRPMNGFCDYWPRLSDDAGYATVIISSGHTDFINSWLDRLGLSRPDAMVTEDDVRKLKEPYAKPDKRIFERAMCPLWTRFPGIRPVAYYGDDPNKDGKLAENAGVPFYHFDPKGEGEGSFSDWSRAPVPRRTTAAAAE